MKKDCSVGKPTFAPLTVKQLRSVDVQAASVRYDRQRPAGGRVRALDRLHEILVYNARLYEGPLQAKRDAVVNSIQAVRDYLADQGFAPATLEPINRPALALIERESNRSDPLFGRARAGAPKRSLALEHRTGAMAAIADQWLRLRPDLGLKQADKLRPLKRKLSGAFFGSVSDANIKRARELVSQEEPDHPAVKWANLYREQLAGVAKVFGPSNAIEIVLHNLNRTAVPPDERDWRT